MKNINKRRVGRSFCMCFGSVVLENGFMVGEGEEPLLSSSTSTSTSSPSEVKPILPPVVNMMTSSDINYKSKNKDVAAGSNYFGRKNKLGRRSFSRYVKAVLFETSLMKKMMRNKKSGQKLKSKLKNKIFNSKSENNINSLINNIPSCDDNNSMTTPSSRFSSGLSSSSSSTAAATSTTTARASRCSSSSQLSGNLQSGPNNSLSSESAAAVERKDGKDCYCYGFNVNIWLLLVSLLVLVMWGKVWAIFCTSTWLLFAYKWRSKVVLSENSAAVNHDPFTKAVDAELYKKKVIMEGFLERNRSQNRSLHLLK